MILLSQNSLCLLLSYRLFGCHRRPDALAPTALSNGVYAMVSQKAKEESQSESSSGEEIRPVTAEAAATAGEAR